MENMENMENMDNAQSVQNMQNMPVRRPNPRRRPPKKKKLNPKFLLTVGVVVALIVLFIIGYIVFCKADKLNKERA